MTFAAGFFCGFSTALLFGAWIFYRLSEQSKARGEAAQAMVDELIAYRQQEHPATRVRH